MKIIYIFFLFVSFTVTTTCAQTYNLAQLEHAFVSENYKLLAAKHNIAAAEALVIQEKLWANPSLSVDEINLWANPNSEVLSPILGHYGRHQQISVELDQLIETGGKRRKRITVGQLKTREAEVAFEALAGELKKELRQSYYHGLTLKYSQLQLDTAVSLFERLAQRYERQVKLQNLSPADYQRVQAALMTLRSERSALLHDIAQTEHTLSVLTLCDDITVNGLEDGQAYELRSTPLPLEIENIAKQNSFELQKKIIATEIAGGSYILEKANAKPDVNLLLGYDRGGNIMQDFIGLGLRIDLPVFNRNKGNISAAKQELHAAKVDQQDAANSLTSELRKNRQLLGNYQKILAEQSTYSAQEQRAMMDSYQKHLYAGQITLMEFLDFAQAVLSADHAMRSMWEDYNNIYEELHYLMGYDF